MGQWVKWVNFLDWSYGSWVDALSPMTHRKHADMPPKKKVKVNPVDWFQHAPDGTIVQSASTTTASTEPLNDRVLREIRKYETEPLPCHTATDVLTHFIGGNSANNLILHCLIAHRRLLVIPASSAECERHFSAYNSRDIIRPTSQRNLRIPLVLHDDHTKNSLGMMLVNPSFFKFEAYNLDQPLNVLILAIPGKVQTNVSSMVNISCRVSSW